jgi:hypothetical protein
MNCSCLSLVALSSISRASTIKLALDSCLFSSATYELGTQQILLEILNEIKR